MVVLFGGSESTFGYFEATRQYIHRYGKPMAFYSDKASIFRVNHKTATNGKGHTQFARALFEHSFHAPIIRDAPSTFHRTSSTTTASIVSAKIDRRIFRPAVQSRKRHVQGRARFSRTVAKELKQAARCSTCGVKRISIDKVAAIGRVKHAEFMIDFKVYGLWKTLD